MHLTLVHVSHLSRRNFGWRSPRQPDVIVHDGDRPDSIEPEPLIEPVRSDVWREVLGEANSHERRQVFVEMDRFNLFWFLMILVRSSFASDINLRTVVRSGLIFVTLFRPRCPSWFRDVRVEDGRNVEGGRIVVATTSSFRIGIGLVEDILVLFHDPKEFERFGKVVFPFVAIVEDIEGTAIEVIKVEVRNTGVHESAPLGDPSRCSLLVAEEAWA